MPLTNEKEEYDVKKELKSDENGEVEMEERKRGWRMLLTSIKSVLSYNFTLS